MKLEYESHYDEKSIEENVKSSKDEIKMREAINLIHSITTKPLKEIMIIISLFHKHIKEQGKISKSKNAVRSNKHLCQTLLGGIILSSMEEFKFSEKEIKILIEGALIQRKNIVEQEDNKNGL